MKPLKKHSINLLLIIASIQMIALLFVSCKQKTTEQAIATFVIGEVTLYRSAESRPLQLKDVLKKGDIIKTGNESILAFQIGQDSVIRILSNSELNVTAVLENNKNSFKLEEGKILATVKRLKKSETYTVRTKTSVAAIRGTEFSVAYNKGKSTVAVNQGKVAVQKIVEDKVEAEETIIEKGTAVEVEKEITTRPISKEEATEFIVAEKIIIVEDIQEKTTTDLKNIENDYLGNKTTEAEETQEIPETREAESTVSDQAIKKEEKAVTPDDAGEPVKAVWTAKRVYKSTDKIVIQFKNLPDSKYVWISVAKEGTKGGNYAHYDWTHAKQKGALIFSDLKLQPGNYEARAHFNRSHKIDLRYSFKVEKE